MTQLPPDVYARIRQFLGSGATGRIEIHVKEGRVLECVVYTVERVRIERIPLPELDRAS